MKARKAVTKGLPPETAVSGERGPGWGPKVEHMVSGSLDDMIDGGERPPELVFLAVVKVYDHSKVEGADLEGFSATVDAAYGVHGEYRAVSGGLDCADECYDAAERILSAASLEAGEYEERNAERGEQSPPKG